MSMTKTQEQDKETLPREWVEFVVDGRILVQYPHGHKFTGVLASSPGFFHGHKKIVVSLAEARYDAKMWSGLRKGA